MPHRGKRNQPAYVTFVAEEIARLRGEPLATIAHATSENFFRLFRIPAGDDATRVGAHVSPSRCS